MQVIGPSMQLHPPPEETIVGIARRIRAAETSSVEIVKKCLQQIDEREPQIQAWVLVDREGSLARARELDAELATGTDRGPLHGIPIAIKDIIDVAGWPTAAGSAGWKDKIAADDAEVVTRLRNSGAILLGKTVTTQYASFDPPVTRNPWNTDRTPGGSSSGSAAAVATGMCLAAMGSQTGGSITRPASFCGVAGCKPTYGRVSLRGIFPLAPNLDHPGPMARSVEDLAVMFDAIVGYDQGDAYCVDRPVDMTAAAIEFSEAVPPRLGRLGGLFVDMADRDATAAFDAAASALTAAGAMVTPTPLPKEFDHVLEPHHLIMAVEAAAVHEERIAAQPDEYGPCVTKLISGGLAAPVTEYVRAREHQVRLKRQMLSCFAGVDALICPATTGAAPDRATTGNPAFNSPWSYTGLPTISFPIGFSDDGLPLAIQIVGRPFEEASLFRTAHWCERIIAERQRGNA